MSAFHGKNVVVTGGAYGIGRGIALGFAGEGANVAIADINKEVGSTVISQINDLGSKAILVAADVSSAKECQKVISETVKSFGGVDILINNVGISPPDSYLALDAVPESLWDRIMNVNLKVSSSSLLILSMKLGDGAFEVSGSWRKQIYQ